MTVTKKINDLTEKIKLKKSEIVENELQIKNAKNNNKRLKIEVSELESEIETFSEFVKIEEMDEFLKQTGINFSDIKTAAENGLFNTKTKTENNL
jgi:hypothetical protein